MEELKCYENPENLSKLIMEAGEVLLESGGEIPRVEDTMKRIAKAYGASADVYTLSNGIFLTLNVNGNETTHIKEVPISSMNLTHVVEVNDLSRAIADCEYTVDEALIELERIKNKPLTDDKIRILFAGFAGATFAYLFDGRFYDCIAAFVTSGLIFIFTLFASRRKFPKFLRTVVGSSLATLLSQLLFNLGLGNNLNSIIIGAIITMVPGVTLTISIREFIFEDYLSGTIHLVDALLVSVGMAVGVITMLEMVNVVF